MSALPSSLSAHLQGLSRVLGFQGFRRTPVRYPAHFKALALVVLCVSVSWVGNYLLVVLPSIQDTRARLCTYNQYNDSQLTYNAKMLFVYFLWFSIARSSLFVPCIASRVAVVQSRTHGFCRTYCVHLIIRDGPLYIFVVGSMLFWFHLVQSPTCEERNPELYQTLKLYAIYSCIVSLLCLLLAYWHNRLLFEAVRGNIEPEDRSAPVGTMDSFETIPYDPALFGEEEGKPYPTECAICLGSWEEGDSIKVTPCHHAFHEECLGHWLRTARTCALCRQDLTKARMVGPLPQRVPPGPVAPLAVAPVQLSPPLPAAEEAPSLEAPEDNNAPQQPITVEEPVAQRLSGPRGAGDAEAQPGAGDSELEELATGTEGPSGVAATGPRQEEINSI